MMVKIRRCRGLGGIVSLVSNFGESSSRSGVVRSSLCDASSSSSTSFFAILWSFPFLLSLSPVSSFNYSPNYREKVADNLDNTTERSRRVGFER